LGNFSCLSLPFYALPLARNVPNLSTTSLDSTYSSLFRPACHSMQPGLSIPTSYIKQLPVYLSSHPFSLLDYKHCWNRHMAYVSSAVCCSV
jgi:hypothetical protein